MASRQEFLPQISTTLKLISDFAFCFLYTIFTAVTRSLSSKVAPDFYSTAGLFYEHPIDDLHVVQFIVFKCWICLVTILRSVLFRFCFGHFFLNVLFRLHIDLADFAQFLIFRDDTLR